MEETVDCTTRPVGATFRSRVTYHATSWRDLQVARYAPRDQLARPSGRALRGLPEFLDVGGQQLAQPLESGLLVEIVAHVAQGSRDVLNIDGVPFGRRLIAKRAKRLEVALQRHHVEAAAKVGV